MKGSSFLFFKINEEHWVQGAQIAVRSQRGSPTTYDWKVPSPSTGIGCPLASVMVSIATAIVVSWKNLLLGFSNVSHFKFSKLWSVFDEQNKATHGHSDPNLVALGQCCRNQKILISTGYLISDETMSQQQARLLPYNVSCLD